jgi:hypothetical protein
LRILFIRALLCDYCNYQFKAFSIRGAPTRPRRNSARASDLLNQSQSADLARLKGIKQSEVIAKAEAPQRLTIDLATLRLQSRTQEEVSGAIVIDQTPQSRRGLKTEITKLYAQGAKDPQRQKDSEREGLSHSTAPTCTRCGSTNVKRRRRTILERLAFSVTDHKAFTCRSCGEPFYSKIEDGGNGRGAFGAHGAAH